jgi:hypothetical protein
MKKLNMFSRLPKEDQTLVLDLCDKLPYHVVVEQLAKPRDEGGLSLTTSAGSLSKFVTRHHPETIAIRAVGEYATAVQVNQQAHGEANFEAILGLVQNRILDSLRKGKSVADLDKDFRALDRVQKCFLADVKFRHKNDHVSDAYLKHVNALARHGDDAEFVYNNVENDPGAGSDTIEDFEDELTQLEIDVDNANDLPAAELCRTPTYFRGAARIVAARKLSERQRAYVEIETGKPSLPVEQLDAIYSANPAQLLALMKANAANAAAAKQSAAPSTVPFPQPGQPSHPSEISDSSSSKSPAISHISPNFALPETAKQTNPPTTNHDHPGHEKGAS